MYFSIFFSCKFIQIVLCDTATRSLDDKFLVPTIIPPSSAEKRHVGVEKWTRGIVHPCYTTFIALLSMRRDHIFFFLFLDSVVTFGKAKRIQAEFKDA